MIGLDAPVFTHTLTDFELRSSAAETYDAQCYGIDLDWTKAITQTEEPKSLKSPPTLSTLIPESSILSDKKHETNHGFYFDLDIDNDQNENLVDQGQPRGETIFPELPPLYQGHPSAHLRNAIANARRLAAAGEPDAEKAFFVADLSQVYKQHQKWMAYLPDIQPHYAVKCNPDPYVIRLLASLGAGFDCASNGEINQVLSIGDGIINPSRIIFANPCKAVSFIRAAAKVGVDMMTFDNVDELYKVARTHPRAKLVIRILTDDSKSLCAFGIKFGATLSNVPLLLAKARELKLDVIGVSFHVGSGCFDPTVYRDAICRARMVFDMAQDVGYHFTLLDIGGGFEDRLFECAAEVLKTALEEYFPSKERKERGLRMIAEPGRFYVATAFKLAVNVIARRAPLKGDLVATREVEEGAQEQPEVMYYINDGVYGAFNCILFDHQTPQPQVLTHKGLFCTQSPHNESQSASNKTRRRRQQRQQLQLASIWGPTCDSIDCVSKGVLLPRGIQVGDWLGFENMGAYTVCAASQFNGFEVSKVIYSTGVGAEAEEVRHLLVEFGKSGVRRGES